MHNGITVCAGEFISIIIDKSLPTKKLKIVLISALIIFMLLIIRLFWIQFIDGANYKVDSYVVKEAYKLAFTIPPIIPSSVMRFFITFVK